jgi:hypothetical protein
MILISALLVVILLTGGCGSKDEATTAKPVEKVREGVKDVVTQDFKTLEAAEDMLKQSEEKTKAALETTEKDLK